MPFWLAVVFGLLIVARVTRFVNADVLGADIRIWANGGKAGQPRLPERLRFLSRAWWRVRDASYAALNWLFRGDLSTLAGCPWCLSIWVSVPVSLYVTLVPLDGVFGKLLTIVGLICGFSYVYSLVSINLDD